MKKMKSWVDDGVRQAERDSMVYTQALIGAMVGVTLVVVLISVTASPESSAHLVNSFRALLGL